MGAWEEQELHAEAKSTQPVDVNRCCFYIYVCGAPNGYDSAVGCGALLRRVSLIAAEDTEDVL